MKHIFVKAFFLSIGLFPLGCGPHDNDNQEQDANALEKFQVAPDIYDNRKGLAYIKANQPKGCNAKYAGAISSILELQGRWEGEFPSKRATSISAVSSYNSCGGHTVLVGLFIKYEWRPASTT